MHGARAGFALVLFLGATIVLSLLLTGISSADCGISVSKYGPCAYKGELLVCGTCALHNETSAANACDRCGAGYRCKANNCALLSHCADAYSCDLCGCSWGPPTRASARNPGRAVP